MPISYDVLNPDGSFKETRRIPKPLEDEILTQQPFTTKEGKRGMLETITPRKPKPTFEEKTRGGRTLAASIIGGRTGFALTPPVHPVAKPLGGLLGAGIGALVERATSLPLPEQPPIPIVKRRVPGETTQITPLIPSSRERAGEAVRGIGEASKRGIELEALGQIGGAAITKGTELVRRGGRFSVKFFRNKIVDPATRQLEININRWTPNIQKFAVDKLKIASKTVDSIRRFGVRNLRLVRQKFGDSTAPIVDRINTGIQAKQTAGETLYKKALDALPENKLLKINNTFNTLQRKLIDRRLIDKVGGRTTRFDAASPVEKNLVKIYEDMRSSLVTGGKKRATGQIAKSDFSFYRDALNRLFRDDPTDRIVAEVKQTLISDADISGVKGLKEANRLIREWHQMNELVGKTIIKENKLNNFQKLTVNEVRKLRALERYIEKPFIKITDAITSGKELSKLDRFGTDQIITDFNRALSDPKQLSFIKDRYISLLGKETADEIFKNLISFRRAQTLKSFGTTIGRGAARFALPLGAAGFGFGAAARRKGGFE